MYQESGEILEHDRLCEDIYRMRIASERICVEAVPGQFALVKVSPGLDPFLRRPFSFHEVHHDSFELLYKVAGRGTSMLAERKCGESLDSIGPLGNGFRPALGRPVLAAGGIGIAPLLFLSRRLKEEGREPLLVYGAGLASSLVRLDQFEKLGVPVKVATEDGSAGFKGTCIQLLEAELSESGCGVVYACGPVAMLAAISGICGRNGVGSCQVSIEERMACGVGACLGCSVAGISGGYLTACKDGPVFERGDIVF